jgi:hypothetical protein
VAGADRKVKTETEAVWIEKNQLKGGCIMKCHVCNSGNKAGQQFCSQCGAAFGNLSRNKGRSFVTTAAVGIFIVAAACSVTNNAAAEKAAKEKDMVVNSCYSINQQVYKKLDFQTGVIKDFEVEFEKQKSLKTDEKSNRGSATNKFDKFLKGELAGYGAKIEAFCGSDIETEKVIAIMRHESDDGSSRAIKELHNPGGIMNSKGLVKFRTLDHGVFYTVQLLKQYKKGGLVTLEQIQKQYCPVGATNDPTGLNKYWLPNVKKFYKQMKGVKV